ncbi:MAG: hypothetical protein LQ341_005520 [Variospora aurantia]|nr:MAG: hypothetical protein LQ341_005520 [Variospora aurantia]
MLCPRNYPRRSLSWSAGPSLNHTNTNLSGNQPQSDAVYDPTTSFWQCCGENSDGKIDCVDPKGRTFRAPAPEALSRFSALSSSATSQATETSTSSTLSAPSSATSSTNAEPSPTPERASSLPTPPPAVASTSSELSVGAKAGVSVGVVLGVAILVLLSVLLYHVRRKGRQPQAALSLSHEHKLGDEVYSQQTPMEPQELSQDSHLQQELPSQNWDSELDANRTYYEMPNGQHTKQAYL